MIATRSHEVGVVADTRRNAIRALIAALANGVPTTAAQVAAATEQKPEALYANDCRRSREGPARTAGAAPEGFSSIENQAQVGRIVESLGMSKIRAANISKELSRVSVFM